MQSNTTPLYYLCQSKWLWNYKPGSYNCSVDYQLVKCYATLPVMLLWVPIFYAFILSEPAYQSESLVWIAHSLMLIRTCSDLAMLDFQLVIQIYNGLIIQAWQTQRSSVPGNFHNDQSRSAGLSLSTVSSDWLIDM